MLVKAYWKPCQGRSHCHWWQARRYHCNWRSSSQSCSWNVRHNALQKCTRISIWTSQVLMPPKPPNWWGTPPNPSTEEKCPHNILISLKHINAQGTNDWVCGCNWRGGTPKQGWCKGGVPTQRGAHHNPPQHAKPPKTQMHRVWGIWGVCTPWGVQMYEGVWMYRGVQMWGIQTPPKYKTCLPLKSREKNPI